MIREKELMKNIKQSVEKIYELMNYLDVTYDFDMIHNALLFFSGNKGFHVYIPAIVFGNWKPSIDLPSKHKALANKILKEGTFDPAIYEMEKDL